MRVPPSVAGYVGDISRRDLLRIASASILFPFLPGLSEGQLAPPLMAAAAWAGTKVLQQTLAFVSGQVLSVAFSQPGISDVKGWIENSLAEVESSIAKLSDKIDANNMNQMVSRLQSLEHQFMEYASLEVALQQQNRALLANCDSLSAELVPLSQNYDQAFFVSTVAMGYRLATLFALFNLDRGSNNSGSGHVSALVATGDGELFTYFRKAGISRWHVLQAMRPNALFRFQCSYEPSPWPFKGPTTSCQVLKDGNPVASSGPMQWDSSLSVAEVREKTAVKAAPLLRGAVKDQVAKYGTFRDQSKKHLQLTWQCFDWMYWTACKARYKPTPEEVTPLEGLDLHFLPDIKWLK